MNRQPNCVIVEDQTQTQIICSLSGSEKSSLEAYLSTDQERLHLLGRKQNGDNSSEFLWTFQLPNPFAAQDITLEQHQDIYLIRIPRWRHSRPLQQLELRALQAC